MKKITLITLLLCSVNLFAQENAIKINASGFAVKMLSVQYEHKFTERFSFNNTFYFRPQTGIPFGSEIDSYAKKRGLGLTGINFEYINIAESEIGVKGYSPELRLYLGKEKNPMFIGAYAQLENFQMKVPAQLLAKKSDNLFEFTAPINFDINTRTIGLLLGKQFNFNNFHVDLVFAGFSKGNASKVNANIVTDLLGELTDEEKVFVQESAIERFNLDAEFYGLDVSDQKADLNSIKKVPFFSLRGAGINIGYRF